MSKWKIWYDVGEGRQEEIIEAANEDDAGDQAYELFAQACELAHSWGQEELTEGSSEVSPGLDAVISEELVEAPASIMKEEGADHD